MTISMIVAASENDAIGKDNKLPWHQPADLKFFKNTTWGMPIIMGRKTFEAMGKALPGRTNIVITSNGDWKKEGATVVDSIDEALKAAKATNCKEAFITGGGEIFKQTLNIADKIYLTRIHAVIEGDVFFPEIDEATWEKDFEKGLKADEKNKHDMSFQTWVRKTTAQTWVRKTTA